MDYLFQDGGKTNCKKGGNFLGSVGELVAPTGWESFATTAGLFALDRADAALRRGKNSAKKGGQSKTSSKKTSSKKGGNFLGSVGELVAPTGWESFATAAGLLAIDRVDAALRRGKSVKSSAKKGGAGISVGDDEKIIIREQIKNLVYLIELIKRNIEYDEYRKNLNKREFTQNEIKRLNKDKKYLEDYHKKIDMLKKVSRDIDKRIATKNSFGRYIDPESGSLYPYQLGTMDWNTGKPYNDLSPYFE